MHQVLHGVPYVHLEVTPEHIDKVAVDEAQRDVWLALELRHAVVVPLVARGRVLGALSLLRTGDQAVPFEFGDELGSGEPIVGRVVEQPPVAPGGQGVGGDLVEVEPASRSQYPGDLAHGRPPVLDVVQDSELEHRVIAAVGRAQRLPQVGDIARGQPDPVTVPGQPPPSPLHHLRIEIDRVHPLGAELP